MKALVLEDEVISGMYLKSELNRQSFHTVEVCSTFQDAESKILSSSFDIIFTDISLSDTYVTPTHIHILRQIQPGIPIVITTGGLSIDIEKHFTMEKIFTLYKPYTPAGLQEVLKMAIKLF